MRGPQHAQPCACPTCGGRATKYRLVVIRNGRPIEQWVAECWHPNAAPYSSLPGQRPLRETRCRPQVVTELPLGVGG